MSYCNMGLEGLWKPELRGKIEQAIRDIASGTKSKEEATGFQEMIHKQRMDFRSCRLQSLHFIQIFNVLSRNQTS